MLAVGLTGGIGSGKSTVSALLAARGAVVVDADAITRQLQEPGEPVFDEIVARFGREVVGADGRLDRPALARMVFSDPAALADLNAIVHPAVGREIAARLAAEAGTDHVVVLDIPLLVENGRAGTDLVVVVDVAEGVALRRLVEQRGMTEDDARARMARQASRDERRAKADVVLDNSGTREELEAQVGALWERLQARATAASGEGPGGAGARGT